jgi:hypothetical protein
MGREALDCAGKPGIPRVQWGFRGPPRPEFWSRSSARGRRGDQNLAPAPAGGMRRKGDNAVMGELANTMKGMGRCEARALPCPTDAPAQRGQWAQRGPSGGVAAGNPKGGGARLRGERGVPAVSSAAPVKPPRCCPLRFPPLGVFEFEGGIRKGGFQGGKTDGGKQRCPGPPTALFVVRMAGHLNARGVTVADSGLAGILRPDRWR